MKCQLCSENVATIHLTEIEDNVKKEIHLCEDCYKSKHELASQPASLDKLIKAFLKNAEDGAVDENVKCPVCGASYAEFHKRGVFGCPEDYAAFADLVKPLLEKIHGSWHHKGKVPAHLLASKSSAERLISLRNELNDVIRNEMYEKAARIRDEIKKLEQESN